MEEEKNYIPIVIVFGIIIFVVLVGVYYLGKSSNSSPLENSQTQDNQTIVDTSAQTPITTLSSKCDTDAKNYFDDYKNKQKDTNSMKIESISYENHYDQNNSSCYVLTKQYVNANIPGITDSSYEMVYYSLVDVSKKDPKGDYQWLGQYTQNIAPNNQVINGIQDCNVGGNQCSSLKLFLSLVNPYLGK